MCLKFRIAHLQTLFAASALGALSATPVVGQETETRVPPATIQAAPLHGQYVVEVRTGMDPITVATSHGAVPKHVYRVAVNGFAGTIPPGKLKALSADPRVVRVVPDRAVAALAKPVGGGGAVTSQVIPEGVKRIGAAPGDNLPVKGAGIGVAVLDTGVDMNHADLQPLGSASYSSVSASANDDNGHGTHVAGIVAARNNSTGVVGVAPEATIYAVKVLNSAGSGSDSSIIAGLNWVASMAAFTNPPIRVVNMSLGRKGSLGDNPTLRTVIQSLTALGVTVIVAAGNDASMEVSQQVPAGYPEVIAVASTAALSGKNQYRFFNGVISADTASYFTTDGQLDPVTGVGVSISAPGEDQEDISKSGSISTVGILSTRLGGGTTRMSGTSMAAPHVAGIAVLLNQQFPGIVTDTVRLRLRLGALGIGASPLNSPTSTYTFDGEREGVASAPGALQ